MMTDHRLVGGLDPLKNISQFFFCHFVAERSRVAVERARVPCSCHTYVHLSLRMIKY